MSQFKSQTYNNQQIFKINTLELIDKITNIELYASQLSRIAYQDSSREFTLEKLASNNQNIIDDIEKIYILRNQINKYCDVLFVILKMINEYDVISQTFKILHEQSKQITSKVSINKEIFKRCKLMYKYTSKYFYNCQSIVISIQKELKDHGVEIKVKKNSISSQ